MKSLPRFRYVIHSTLDGRRDATIQSNDQYVSLDDIISRYEACSLSDASTWQFTFGYNGFLVEDTCYIDEDYDMFYDGDVALDKAQHGERIITQVWKLAATPDRPLTKGDKRAILALANKEQEEERKLSEVLGHEVSCIEED